MCAVTETIGKVYPNMALAAANARLPHADVLENFRTIKYGFRNTDASIAAAANLLHTRMKEAVATQRMRRD